MLPRDWCNFNILWPYNDFPSLYSKWYSRVFAVDTCNAWPARQHTHWTGLCRMLPLAFLSNPSACKCPSRSSFHLSSPSPSLASMCSSKFQLSSAPPASHHTSNQMPPLPLICCPECNVGYMVWFISGTEEKPGRHFYKCERHGASF